MKINFIESTTYTFDDVEVGQVFTTPHKDYLPHPMLLLDNNKALDLEENVVIELGYKFYMFMFGLYGGKYDEEGYYGSKWSEILGMTYDEMRDFISCEEVPNIEVEIFEPTITLKKR